MNDRNMESNNHPHALAVCTTAIGDTMFCTPAIAALAEVFTLDVLCHVKRAPLLQNNPHINKIYAYRNNGLRRAAAALRMLPNHYRRIAILHANDDVKKILPFLRYQSAWNIQGWNDDKLKLKALYRDIGKMHVIDMPLLVAQACGAVMPPLPQRKPQLFLSPAEITRARIWLAQNGYKDKAPLVGLVVGGSSLEKRWPISRFTRLALDLQRQGVQTVVIGGKNEAGLAAEMAKSTKIIPALELDLRLLCALTAQLTLLVGNDTGPLHIAHALDIPSVSLFGITNPAIIAPRHPLHRVLSAHSFLSSCGRDQIMEQISYDDVWLAVAKELARE
jgi:ADP-heptose:LPS heptosyltransferase